MYTLCHFERIAETLRRRGGSIEVFTVARVVREMGMMGERRYALVPFQLFTQKW